VEISKLEPTFRTIMQCQASSSCEWKLLTAQNGSRVSFLQNMSINYTMTTMMVMSRSSKVWATSPRRNRPCLICPSFKRHQQL